jgi:nickel superoxide dismutase
MYKRAFQSAAVLLVLLVSASYAMAHCEIPCGIYGDKMRVKMIEEHASTIEKAMNRIQKLQKEKDVNYNQLVRWIDNKDEHATKLQDIVSQYFLHQRIKIDEAHYEKQLVLLHKMLVYAMKCKQTTDLENVRMLRSLLQDFEAVYFEEE